MKFKLVAYGEMDASAFPECSAWGQYYEPSDIESLVSLGYEIREVHRLIEATGWSDDFWFPIPDGAEPGTFQFEHRRAHIQLANGTAVEGYVVNRGHTICLFGKADTWVINTNFLDLHEDELPLLRRDLGLELDASVLPAQVDVPVVGWSFVFPR